VIVLIRENLFQKVTTIPNALDSIHDDSVVAVSGFNLAATPEHLILRLYERYEKTGHPKNLFLICEALPAVPGRALDYVSEQLFKKKDREFLGGVLIPFFGFSPWSQKLVEENLVEAYSWPIGVVAYWFREIASGRPGLITKIGIDTLLDPRKEAGALNEAGAKKMRCRIKVIEIESEEFLYYNAPKPNFGLIRASYADESGNLSMADEGIRGTVLNIAQATKARPNVGTVVAQVRWITITGTINPRDVDVPAPLVDHIVISPRSHHWQGGTFEYDPRVAYRIMQPIDEAMLSDVSPSKEHGYEKIIARRVLLELVKVLEEKRSPVLVNLGVGIPALVSAIAAEEEVSQYIITVLESGIWGGIALPGQNFGLAHSPFALSSMPDMFSNFEGGVIDAASLGFLQVDPKGDVNPSILPGRMYGPGGFPVIAEGAPRIYFAGAFTGGQSKIHADSAKLDIVTDGAIPKFINKVYRTVFSGKEAMKYEKEVLYITERAVFRLTKGRGIIIEEIAPGIDLEKHVIEKMQFEPSIDPHMKEMDLILFKKEKMGMKKEIDSFFKK
jgi:propionate CoA-transferase